MSPTSVSNEAPEFLKKIDRAGFAREIEELRERVVARLSEEDLRHLPELGDSSFCPQEGNTLGTEGTVP